MAQKVHVVLEDDLEGGPADDTVTFGLDGVSYEIDLSEKNAERLREMLAPYVGAGRRLGGRTGGQRRATRRSARTGESGGSGGRAGGDVDTAAVRAWAREHGRHVSDRGRLPATLIQEYQDATR